MWFVRIVMERGRREETPNDVGNVKEKDINDMVLAGHDVQSIVESNVYNGLKAKLQFNTWKRI